MRPRVRRLFVIIAVLACLPVAMYLEKPAMKDPFSNNIFWMVEINPRALLDYQWLGDQRPAYYAGISSRFSKSVDILFSYGENELLEKIVADFAQRSRPISEALSLFRTRDHVAYLNQAACDGKLGKEFGSVYYQIMRYSGRKKDYEHVAKCMDAIINRDQRADINGGLQLLRKSQAEKAYRFVLWKGYVRDFRAEEIDPDYRPNAEQLARSAMFTRLGDLALVTTSDAAYILPSAMKAAAAFHALGEEQMLSELLKQFEHCGTVGCTTPELEGTLFSIGFLISTKAKDAILDYVQRDGTFARTLSQNTHYFTWGPARGKRYIGDDMIFEDEDYLRQNLKKILFAKGVAANGVKPDEDYYHIEYLGNFDGLPIPDDYNPYAIRHKLLLKHDWTQ